MRRNEGVRAVAQQGAAATIVSLIVIREMAPKTMMVFDKFHIVQHFNEAADQIRAKLHHTSKWGFWLHA